MPARQVTPCYDLCGMAISPTFALSVPDDTERFRQMAPSKRLALFLELCDLTDAIVAGRPDPDALRAPTPRSVESEALWRHLMASYRRDLGLDSISSVSAT